MNDNGSSPERVVITGVGVVSPVGTGVDTTWKALREGVSGGGAITHFEAGEDYPTRIACEVKDFEPTDHLDAKEARRFDRFSQFALAATQEAMADAGLGGAPEGLDPTRFGVVFGSGIGGIETFEEQCRVLLEKGAKRVSPFFVPMFIPDIAAGLISMRYGAKGPNYATVSACATSANAMVDALRILQRGDADVMIAGGSEATITRLAVAGFAAMKAMSTRNEDPEHASRPFDAGRDGFVMGEGAATVVLETESHARARGATVYAEVAGAGLSADAHHITAPAPDGSGARSAMQLALDDIGAAATDVDYVNAHGTSTPLNDRAETAAVKAVFGEHAYALVMGSTKSMTGHLLGAAGALEAVICALACRDGVIPPTINYEEPDPDCDLDYAVNGPVERPVRLALSNSFGFGGHNVCLAVRRWDG